MKRGVLLVFIIAGSLLVTSQALAAQTVEAKLKRFILVSGNNFEMAWQVLDTGRGEFLGETFTNKFKTAIEKAKKEVDDSKGRLSLLVSRYDLAKPLSSAYDTDKDKLPDDLEKIIGTAINKADTDGDKHNDFVELLNGYSPYEKNKLLTTVNCAKLVSANRPVNLAKYQAKFTGNLNSGLLSWMLGVAGAKAHKLGGGDYDSILKPEIKAVLNGYTLSFVGTTNKKFPVIGYYGLMQTANSPLFTEDENFWRAVGDTWNFEFTKDAERDGYYKLASYTVNGQAVANELNACAEKVLKNTNFGQDLLKKYDKYFYTVSGWLTPDLVAKKSSGAVGGQASAASEQEIFKALKDNQRIKHDVLLVKLVGQRTVKDAKTGIPCLNSRQLIALYDPTSNSIVHYITKDYSTCF